jgi:hypothetical protein
MSKFVCTALALIGAGTAAQADPTADAWLGLDQEISNLNTSIGSQDGGIQMGALIRSSYLHAEDDLGLSGTEDTGGWTFQDVDVWLGGASGDYSWRVSTDADSGTAGLEDAYATWNASDNFSITWGQFKAPVTMSTSIDPERMAFVDRTAIGQLFDNWQLGAMISGGQDGFSWFVAVQNGGDGIADEYRLSGRAELSIGGHESGWLRNGGSDGSSDEIAGTAGIFFSQDDGEGAGDLDNTIIGLDAAGTMGAFSAHAEVASFDDDNGDNSPFSFALGYLLNADWHGAVRMQDADNDLDESQISLALAWLQADATWTFEVGSADSDDGGLDGTFAQVNLSIGASR